ncbi:NACHT domain-containing protein [Amycolatopsis sp. NPDC088138]|uniref:NACHT domain-containing protein n=1 Tax=Amycolatopsis sp. NPDC088138 TaxID=3363938 RepID=UPI003801F5CC
MSGVDTVRGIGYQQAHAVRMALDVYADDNLGALRVEGTEDVMDIEIHDILGAIVAAAQLKSRVSGKTWGRKELLAILRTWATLDIAKTASFELITNGKLGPTGDTVRNALEAAAEGDLTALAELLDTDVASSVCRVLSRARIRLETSDAETVLNEAEREVRSMLPGARTPADLAEAARRIVDELFRLLMDRAARRDPAERIVTKEKIAEVLGRVAHVAEPDRWPGSLQAEYQSKITDIPPATVSAKLVRLDSVDAQEPGVTVQSILDSSGPVLIAGGTGTGKSTAAAQLRYEAALSGRTVLIGHAETYLEGRLDALVADSLSASVGRALPAITGRQLLNDSRAILVIDGVSEVPQLVRDRLRDEIRVLTATGTGARIALIGRDLAVLGSVLPVTAASARFRVAGFGRTERRELVERIAGEAHPGEHGRLTAQVEHALGDAAGNPMLVSMATGLLLDGTEFTDRASIYRATVTRLAERGKAAGLDVAAAVLGIVFANLLDEGRRYANPVEWHRLLHDAARKLGEMGVPVELASLRETVQRTGLVTSIGQTQTQTPIHDSFADYLAGAAAAEGLVRWPERLDQSDEQRVLFAAALGNVGGELAGKVARDVPYLTVRLAGYDTRPIGASGPSEIFELLKQLAPADSVRPARLWHDGTRLVASLAGDVPSWIEPADGKKLTRTSLTAICDPPTGPLGVAVRLWRLLLQETLTNRRAARKSSFASAEAARSALEQQAAEEVQALTKLVPAVAPPGKAEILAAAVGPYGLTAVLREQNEVHGVAYWPVEYRRTDEVVVRAEAPPDTAPFTTRTVVSSLVEQSADQAAAARIRAAINELTTKNWL